MWQCPICKARFYNKNQSHSCGQYSLDTYLKGKSSHSIALFNALIKAFEQLGPFELHPVKTRVALYTKMRFASINKLGKDHLDGHIVLTESKHDKPLFFKIENLKNRFYIHHFRIYTPEDITKDLKKIFSMAYDVGQRKHIKK